MVDVALATAAAPTYFPTHRSAVGVPLVDGGIWANNPVGMAVVEVIGVLGRDRRELKVLSLGCSSEPLNAGMAIRYGLGWAYWEWKSVPVFMSAQFTKFPPGISGNPKGRPRGAPNKATREVRALARRLVEDREYQAGVRRRLRAGEAGALEPLLWHYAYGKPKEAVELSATGVAIIWQLPIDPKTFRKTPG